MLSCFQFHSQSFGPRFQVQKRGAQGNLPAWYRWWLVWSSPLHSVPNVAMNLRRTNSSPLLPNTLARTWIFRPKNDQHDRGWKTYVDLWEVSKWAFHVRENGSEPKYIYIHIYTLIFQFQKVDGYLIYWKLAAKGPKYIIGNCKIRVSIYICMYKFM